MSDFIIDHKEECEGLEIFRVNKEYFDLDSKQKLELIKLMDEWLYFQKIKLNE